MAKYIECEAAYRFAQDQLKKETGAYSRGWNHAMNVIKSALHNNDALPAEDVVARDCFDKILAENDDLRAIIDTYGGLDNIQSAFVKLHEIETADVVPVRHAIWRYKTMTVPGGRGQTYAKWSCTACKAKQKERSKYCPNCGARMDKGGDGE